MENYDGYVTGETPVVFVGGPYSVLDTVMVGFERVYEITGNWNTYILGSAGPSYYQAYFDYILINPAIMADSETWAQTKEKSEVIDMPCYPSEGCIALVDGVLVVKLS